MSVYLWALACYRIRLTIIDIYYTRPSAIVLVGFPMFAMFENVEFPPQFDTNSSSPFTLIKVYAQVYVSVHR